MEKKIMTVTMIAQICHEINRAYCQGIGDNSQPDWENAPDWQKESAINGVNFHLHNPDAGPDASHKSWMKEKVESGWVHGPVKDPEKKFHPCIVPFDKLPVEQQAKDFLFRQTVHSLKQFWDQGGAVVDQPDTQPDTQAPMTYGEKAVGVSFNPSGAPDVNAVKHEFAGLIDRMDMARKNTESGEKKRMASIAITELQTAQMWAVKTLTWND